MARSALKETKDQLHELIDLVEDQDILELYLQVLQRFNQQTTFEPTPEEVEAVMQGLESVKKHGTVSHEDAVARLRKKFPDLIL